MLEISRSAPSGSSSSLAGSASSAAVVVSLALCAAVSVVYFQPRWLMRWVAKSSPQVLWFADTSHRVCALTVDDAPSNSTHLLLDVLAKYNVKATFFVISGNIPGREEVMRRIVREGHFLGNHLTEDRASIKDDPEVFERKLKECDFALRFYRETSTSLTADNAAVDCSNNKTNDSHKDSNLGSGSSNSGTASSTQVDPLQVTPLLPSSSNNNNNCGGKWLRPGSGWFNNTMQQIAHRNGYRLCLGSVYPHDAQIRLESVNAMYLRTQTYPGSVIIVHDRSWTVGVLRQVLPELVTKFRFVSLDELASLDRQGPLRSLKK